MFRKLILFGLGIIFLGSFVSAETILCYQETANISNILDGDCSLSYTGSYEFNGSWVDNISSYDADWETYTLTEDPDSDVFINYTKPPYVLNGSFIEIKIGTSSDGVVHTVYCKNSSSWNLILNGPDSGNVEENITIPPSCLDQNNLQIRYNYNTGYHGHNGYLYEEAMWWNITSEPPTPTKYNHTRIFGNTHLAINSGGRLRIST